MIWAGFRPSDSWRKAFRNALIFLFKSKQLSRGDCLARPKQPSIGSHRKRSLTLRNTLGRHGFGFASGERAELCVAPFGTMVTALTSALCMRRVSAEVWD